MNSQSSKRCTTGSASKLAIPGDIRHNAKNAAERCPSLRLMRNELDAERMPNGNHKRNKKHESDAKLALRYLSTWLKKAAACVELAIHASLNSTTSSPLRKPTPSRDLSSTATLGEPKRSAEKSSNAGSSALTAIDFTPSSSKSITETPSSRKRSEGYLNELELLNNQTTRILEDMRAGKVDLDMAVGDFMELAFLSMFHLGTAPSMDMKILHAGSMYNVRLDVSSVAPPERVSHIHRKQ